MIVSIYNSAGELVKTLFHGSGTQLSDLALSGGSVVPGSLGLTLSFSGSAGGSSSLSWLGDNDNGQLVSGGTYSMKVETKDNFGTTSAWIRQISVIPSKRKVALKIYSSAGELVAALDPAAAGAVSPSQLKFGGDGKGAFEAGSATIVVVDSNGAEITVPLGQELKAGSYTVQLVNEDLGASKIIASRGFVLVAAPKAPNFSAIAFPNPLGPENSPLQFLYAPRPAAETVTLRLYNVPGELVAQAVESASLGRITLAPRPWAAGIYIAVLELRQGRSLLSRRLLKVAIR